MSHDNPIRDLATVIRGVSEASIALGNRDARAQLLDGIAAALDAARAEIIAVAADETALYPEELEPEFDRMSGTLRMFAAIVRDGSWVRAAIDTPVPVGEKSIGPNHDIRRMLVPLGPVAVFGASNFPLAYGVCGGDTASALAAGCPVIVKEHPAHPKTGRLLVRLARQAASSANCTEAVLSYLHNSDVDDFEPARLLLQVARAVGFTGSQKGGLAIAALAANRRIPMPVFAEMGSVNVLVVTAAAANARGVEIADQIADSILARFGQQCTRPGFVVIEPCDGEAALTERLAARIAASEGRDMLAPWIRDAYVRRCDEVQACRGVDVLARGGEEAGASGAAACLFAVKKLYLKDSDGQFAVFGQDALREEVFGPACIVAQVFPDMLGDLWLPDPLAISVYAEPNSGDVDAGDLDCVVPHACRHAGRLTFNTVPTGVRVCTSMVHGGPFPATNRPDTTAVGPLAIERWCRPVCFQNCPEALLPPELQNANPLGIWRTVNGQPTRGPVEPGAKPDRLDPCA